jgi:hypothetical protein
VQRDDDVLWMRACIWPGETERLARFEAAVQVLRATAKAASPPVVERLSASLIPKRLESFAKTHKSALLLANQSLLRGYLDSTERETFRQEMMDFVSRQDAGRVLWVELELDDARRRLPAVLIAHVRVGATVKSLRLGRCSQHPTQIEVDTAGVEELRKRLSQK